MVAKLIKFPGRQKVVEPLDIYSDYQLERQKVLEKLALTPKKVIVTGLAGVIAGFLTQQNRGTLDQIGPHGQLATGAFANIGFLVGKDLYFFRVTNRPSGHSTNLKTDLKYLGVFNGGGVLGYAIGYVKDLIT